MQMIFQKSQRYRRVPSQFAIMHQPLFSIVCNIHVYAKLFFVFQIYIVSLLAVTGGARIGENSLATVMILANDNPYGFVALEVPTLITTEEDNDSVALVPVVRRYSYTSGHLI